MEKVSSDVENFAEDSAMQYKNTVRGYTAILDGTTDILFCADYGKVLLHIWASDMISEPLMELLNKNDDKTSMIECYILLIEIMWKMGDEVVQNVVDVTVLERLGRIKNGF